MCLQDMQQTKGVGCVVVTITVRGLSVFNAVAGAMSKLSRNSHLHHEKV